MNTQKKLLASIVAASFVIGAAGCSSSNSSAPTAPTAPEAVAPLAAQTATIVINDVNSATPTVSISSQPADIELSGTATDAGAGIVELELAAVNNATRVLTNLKAVVDHDDMDNPVISADVGVDPTVSVSSGTFDTKDYTYFGPVIAQGGTGTSNQDGNVFTLSGIDGGASSVTMEVTLPTDHPLIAYNRWNGNPELRLADSMTGESTLYETDDTTVYGKDTGDSGGGFTSGVGTLDSTTIYAGGRTFGKIFTINLNTLNDTEPKPVSSFSISDDPIASVKKVLMDDAETTLYAILNEGSHLPNYDIGYTDEVVTKIVKVDIEGQEVTASADLMTNTAEPRVKDMDITDDGATAVVSVTSNAGDAIYVVNLEDMTVTIEVPVLLDYPEDQRLRTVEISDDGTTVYAMYYDDYNSDSDLLIIDVESGDIERHILAESIQEPREMEIGPDGDLYIASDEGLHKVDLTTFLVVKFDTDGDDLSKIKFNHDGTVLYVATRGDTPGRAYAFDVATGDRIDLDGDTTDSNAGPVSLPTSGGTYGHFMIISTY